MKHSRLLTLIMAAVSAFAVAMPRAAAANDLTSVFVFGVAGQMTDTVVYMTPIQLLDSAQLTRGTKFLLQRPYLARQLKDYFASQGQKDMLCVVYFASDRKSIDRKFNRLQRRYGDSGGTLLRNLTPGEFSFTQVLVATADGRGRAQRQQADDEQ